MSTVTMLLARRHQLQQRLDEAPGAHERAEIERFLAEIDTALELLDEAGPRGPTPPTHSSG